MPKKQQKWAAQFKGLHRWLLSDAAVAPHSDVFFPRKVEKLLEGLPVTRHPNASFRLGGIIWVMTTAIRAALIDRSMVNRLRILPWCFKSLRQLAPRFHKQVPVASALLFRDFFGILLDCEGKFAQLPWAWKTWEQIWQPEQVGDQKVLKIHGCIRKYFHPLCFTNLSQLTQNLCSLLMKMESNIDIRTWHRPIMVELAHLAEVWEVYHGNRIVTLFDVPQQLHLREVLEEHFETVANILVDFLPQDVIRMVIKPYFVGRQKQNMKVKQGGFINSV